MEVDTMSMLCLFGYTLHLANCQRPLPMVGMDAISGKVSSASATRDGYHIHGMLVLLVPYLAMCHEPLILVGMEMEQVVKGGAVRKAEAEVRRLVNV
eukprot:1143059-Pelagomonas_calceolata.AAC.2